MTIRIIPTPYIYDLSYGVTLACYPAIGKSPDSLGGFAYWDLAIKQLFQNNRFRSFFHGTRIDLWDKSRNEPNLYDNKPSVEDYLKDVPGDQGASLFYPGQNRIALAVNPENLNGARDPLAHEWGHKAEWDNKLATGNSSFHIKYLQAFDALRPHKGHNRGEDYSELYRYFMGHNDVIGSFSDGSKPILSLKLKSALRCHYWLEQHLRDKHVSDIVFMDTGVRYQAIIDGQYRWRFIDHEWRSQEYDGKGAWFPI